MIQVVAQLPNCPTINYTIVDKSILSIIYISTDNSWIIYLRTIVAQRNDQTSTTGKLNYLFIFIY